MYLTSRLESQPQQPKQLNKQGLNFYKLGCPNPAPPHVRTTEPIGGFAARALFVLIQSCGYACFWGLFGCFTAFWRVFEVVLQVLNFRTLNGVVARVQSIRDNMQVIGLKIVVMALIRNRKMLDLRL